MRENKIYVHTQNEIINRGSFLVINYADLSANMSISVEKIHPGSFIDWHMNREKETEYILEGCGFIDFVVKKNKGETIQTYSLAQGDFVTIPPNIPHRTRADKKAKGIKILTISEPEFTGDIPYNNGRHPSGV